MEEAAALARELALPEPVMKPLEDAFSRLPALDWDAFSSPECAGPAWEAAEGLLPGWEEDGGMAHLAAMLAGACRTRRAYRARHIPEEVFAATMGCFSRFLTETRQLTGKWAFDRGFWSWRQVGCRLFRLGALEFEYCLPAGGGEPFLSVHIPSDASLARDALDGSYEWARRFFREEGRAFCYGGPPCRVECESWLLAPALDKLLPEGSGIRRFAGDYRRTAVDEESTEFYRWLFHRLGPVPAGELPEDTSLRRGAKNLLLSGDKIGSACGLLSGENAWRP